LIAASSACDKLKEKAGTAKRLQATASKDFIAVFFASRKDLHGITEKVEVVILILKVLKAKNEWPWESHEA
jgi:precorrin-3B methylase